MGIKDIPADYAAFERFNIDYEKRHFRFTDANRRVGAATLDMFASWFPRLLRPLVRRAMYAIMDDPLIEAFGFPKPSPVMRAVVTAALRLRARLLRLLPARRRRFCGPKCATAPTPNGYRIEELGPPSHRTHKQRVGR